MASEEKYPPILILGCGRSGTSIFGELFQDLCPYRYQSEPTFADMLCSFGEACAAKVPTQSDGFLPDPGLSFPLSALFERYPSTKLFWIVRHPLDAVSSLRVGISNRWRHHPRPPDWKEWLERSVVARSAHHWSYINSHGFDAVSNKATLVRFEDMIRSPSHFVAGVCAEIGLSFVDRREQVRPWINRVQDANNEEFIEAQTSRFHSRSNHSVRVGRWRENLTTPELREAAKIVRRASERFGYNVPDIKN